MLPSGGGSTKGYVAQRKGRALGGWEGKEEKQSIHTLFCPFPGLLMYFGYGIWHSTEGQWPAGTGPRELPGSRAGEVALEPPGTALCPSAPGQ